MEEHIVLYGFSATFYSSMEREAAAMGARTCAFSTRDHMVRGLIEHRPALALINVDRSESADIVMSCRSVMRPSGTIIGISDVPCLIRAAEMVRRGAHLVLARPTTLAQIVALSTGEQSLQTTPMSLDRAIWEYLNQTLVESGSIAAAARRLKLDRTSFKRMLRKRPFT